MVKKVIIVFADPRINPKEHAKDLKDAIEHAYFNLRYRSNIVIQGFTMDDDGLMHLKIFIPDGVKFNAGNRLRGISNYLISQCEFPYKEYRVGNRLLHYFPSKQKADFRKGKYNDPEYWKNLANRKKKRDATTIDAEPVVRCDFCVKYGNALACPYSASTGELPDPQDYCSMGVRKKDGGNIDG